jgi:ABC-2 type transport system permease protein
MTARMVKALLLKDLQLFFANRFFALVTILGLAAYTAIYWLLPAQVDATLRIGVTGLPIPAAVLEALRDDGVELETLPDEASLRAAVLDNRIGAGFVVSANGNSGMTAAQAVPVRLLIHTAVPAEYEQLYSVFLNELFGSLDGRDLPLAVQREFIGPDLSGMPVTPQQRIRPMPAVMVLMVECLGLAGLIAAEIEQGTMRALLTTPLTVRGLLTAKAVFGTIFAFAQALLITALTGGFAVQPALTAAGLFGGALLVTAVAFVVGAVGRDLLSVFGWGLPALVILALPLLNLGFPGLTSDWINLIPSSMLVEIVYRSSVYGAGWTELAPQLIGLPAAAAVLFVLGGALLTRRFR